MSAGLRAYRKAAANLAPPHERAIAAHDRALDCLRQALATQERGEFALHKALLCRAIALVGALPAEIDPERGGELGQALLDLYDYMGARLVEANARGGAEPIRDVIAVLDKVALGFRRSAPSA